MTGPRALLRDAAFGRVWAASFASETAEWIVQVALPLYVYRETGSAALLAAGMTLGLLSGLVVSPVAGLVVDRVDRRRLMCLVSLVQAVTVLPLLAVSARTPLAPVLAVMALQAGLAALFEPARNALIPRLVGAPAIPAANGLMGVGTNLARLLGAWLGGLTLQLGGLRPVVGAYVALLAVTAALLARRLPGTGERAATAERESLGKAALRGMTEIAGRRALRRTVGVFGVMSLAQGMFLVLFVLFVRERLGGGEGDVGLLRGVQAVGGLAAGLLLGVLAGKADPARLLGWSLLALGGLSALIWNGAGLVHAIPAHAVFFALLGAPAVLTGAGLLSLLQTGSGDESMGRVLGMALAVGAACQAAGMQAAGALAGTVPLTGLLDVQAGLYLLAGALALAWAGRRCTLEKPPLTCVDQAGSRDPGAFQ
ncbi:MFS transporter [Streptomyces sp. NPDC049879]|uniref:MFS transporter n=1 Tax=Streptomyces sp. NPDC049879 TaxID=3365598 RepID=UPI0037A99D3E